MSEQSGGEGALERERDLQEEERKIAEHEPAEGDPALDDTAGLDPDRDTEDEEGPGLPPPPQPPQI
jgi:hypothetical protein